MSVRAKFYVSNVERNEAGSATTVYLGAVCRGAENRVWASYTPAGNLNMTIRNEVAAAQFEVGQEFWLTFEPAPKPQPGDGHPVDPVQSVPPPGEDDGGRMCATCGVYGGGAHGKPVDWTAHDELFG